MVGMPGYFLNSEITCATDDLSVHTLRAKFQLNIKTLPFSPSGIEVHSLQQRLTRVHLFYLISSN
jgi:hypothetical protein